MIKFIIWKAQKDEKADHHEGQNPEIFLVVEQDKCKKYPIKYLFQISTGWPTFNGVPLKPSSRQGGAKATHEEGIY